jgi:hypothetical protein
MKVRYDFNFVLIFTPIYLFYYFGKTSRHCGTNKNNTSGSYSSEVYLINKYCNNSVEFLFFNFNPARGVIEK